MIVFNLVSKYNIALDFSIVFVLIYVWDLPSWESVR